MDYGLEFSIPSKRDDLLNCGRSNHYFVSSVISGADLHEKLEECKTALSESGCDSVVEHFDTLFSLLRSFDEFDFTVLQNIYSEIVLSGLNELCLRLELTLSEEHVDSETQDSLRNSLKMMIFFTAEFLMEFSQKIEKHYNLVIQKKGKKNLKSDQLKKEYDVDWEERQFDALNIVRNIIKLPLRCLWSPSLVDDDFIRLVADMFYRVFETPTITAVKMKPFQDMVFDTFALLNRNYGHTLSWKLKTVDLLKSYEFLPTTMAQMVVYFVDHYEFRSIVNEIISEVIEVCMTLDSSAAHDNGPIKSLCSFITEFVTLKPELLVSSVDTLLECLTCECYLLRVCVLTVVAQLIISVLREGERELTKEDITLRDSMLNLLLDSTKDCHASVRSKVLKLWHNMIKVEAVPNEFLSIVLNVAVERLHDKTVNVTRNAIQLITTLIKRNRWRTKLSYEYVSKEFSENAGPILTKKEQQKEDTSIVKLWLYNRCAINIHFIKKFDDMQKEIATGNYELDPEEGYSSHLESVADHVKQCIRDEKFEDIFDPLYDFERKQLQNLRILSDLKDSLAYYQYLVRSCCLDCTFTAMKRVEDSGNVNDLKEIIHEPFELEITDEEFSKNIKFAKYYEEYLNFVMTINDATTVIGELMMSGTNTETIEAIEYFKFAKVFQISDVDIGLRKMLLLANSKDDNVKECVISAFKYIYLYTDPESNRSKSSQIMTNLTKLLKTVNLEQKNALDDVIERLVRNNDLGKEFALFLWTVFSNDSTELKDRKAAAILIKMCARANPIIVQSNIDLIIDCLRKRNEYTLIKYTCDIITGLFGQVNDSGVLIKYPSDSELIKNVVSFVEEEFSNLGNKEYDNITISAIHIIYKLSVYPTLVCKKILNAVYNQLPESAKQNNDDVIYESELLARYLLIFDRVVIGLLQYLENDVQCELKRRQMLEKKEELSRIGTSKSGESNTLNEDVLQNQIADKIRIVCETELFHSENFLSRMGEVVINVCRRMNKYECAHVQSAASVAFLKMLLVSQRICDENMRLYVTMMERNSESQVKINLILGFGDLTFRFPNVVEPWASFFYGRLRDECVDVRYNVLTVISHLITNEMVVIKKHMFEVALCLIDPDPSIQRMIFKLFTELSAKGNVLYNVLPDIISRLSHPDHRPSQENFRTILKGILKFITKEAHMENLVQKLCERIASAEDDRQCSDLTYCLTLIKFNEKALEKLLVDLVTFSEKLENPMVLKYLEEIAAVYKKSKNSKVCELANELEAKLSIILTSGSENIDLKLVHPIKTPIRRMNQSVATSARIKRRREKN